MIPTLINVVAAFTSVGVVSFTSIHYLSELMFTLIFHLKAFMIFFELVNIQLFIIQNMQGTVLCDIILLNFLKGAEQYKAKKFEEVK